MVAVNLHPIRGGVRYTLRGTFREEAAAASASSRLKAKRLDAIVLKLAAPNGTDAWHVAARHDVQPRERAALPHGKTTELEAVAIAVSVFRMIIRAAERRGRAARWYKHLDLDRLRRLVGSYRWTGTRLDVAASMLSQTILAHPFPNANHRTSLALVRAYLECSGVTWPHFTLRGRGLTDFTAKRTGSSGTANTCSNCCAALKWFARPTNLDT